MNTVKISSLVLTAFCFISPITHADDVPTAVVKYGDLDLGSAPGIKTLYRRISVAAYSVCAALEPLDLALEISLKPRYEACLRNAVADAVAKVNRPALMDFAMAKGGARPIKLAAR
jgi:UrcA family protein